MRNCRQARFLKEADLARRPQGKGARWRACGAALAVMLQAAVPAAQEAGDPGAEASVVLVVSMDRIRAESRAAKSIEAQADTLRSQIEADLAARQENLAAEERALVALRETLAPDAFEARAARFEQQVRLMKQQRRETAQALRRSLRRAADQLDLALRPILGQIMSERGASVMIDNRNVVLSARALDVTPLAIERLDAALPSLDVAWPPGEEGG